MTILDDVYRDDTGLKQTAGFILDAPERVPYVMLYRLGFFFGLEWRALTYFDSNDFFGYIPATVLVLIAGVVLIPFILVSSSAMLGVALIHWEKRTMLLGLLFVGYISTHILIIAEDRFRLTLIPLMAILTAYCWVAGWQAVKNCLSSRNGRIAISLGSLAILLLDINWVVELWLDMDKVIQLLGPWGNRTHSPY